MRQSDATGEYWWNQYRHSKNIIVFYVIAINCAKFIISSLLDIVAP